MQQLLYFCTESHWMYYIVFMRVYGNETATMLPRATTFLFGSRLKARFGMLRQGFMAEDLKYAYYEAKVVC